MDKNQPIYFLMNSIDVVKGGLTRASLKQASTFAEMGYDVHMLTFNYNLNYPKIRKKLLDLGKINPAVKIRNIYEDMEEMSENERLTPASPKEASLSNLADGGNLDKRDGYNAFRVYKNGLYVKYIALNEDDSLKFIDYFNENRYRTKRVEYDLIGNIRRILYMDYENNKPRQTIHFNKGGTAYLSIWTTSSGKIQRINIFQNNGEIEKVYTGAAGDISFKQSWLQRCISGKRHPIIVTDTRSTDELLATFQNKDAIKIWRLHSSHLDKPFSVDAPITKKVKTGVKYLTNFDGVLLLTNQQRVDLIERFGNNSLFYVVPHFHEQKKKKSLLNSLPYRKNQDEKKAVIISRLSTLKRIDHAIYAFKEVVNDVPDAKLEIWGKGDEESNLTKLINELGLQDSIEIKGYTHEPDKIYKSALFSVLTSKSEGFALSVLESMVNKTPVISYNIRYGPNELISNNETGFLVENGSTSELSRKMIELFKNPEAARRTGENAADFIDQNYSKELYKKKWIESLNDIINKKKS
ncbi:glycosyltransferase [Halobacillus ihumii]|uniref:glycosyltransferase n=1 Tax=Halobacillus ihumii TaxID=2686092 RepID=UPI0013D4B289|nr:glycosyltransferase [Halobacillus ihumii]